MVEDVRRDDKIKIVWDRLGKVEVFFVFDDFMVVEVVVEFGFYINDVKEDLFFVKEFSNDIN